MIFHNTDLCITKKNRIVIADHQENNTFMLDLTRLVYQYVQVYMSNDASNSLQYICLLSLYSPKHGYHDQSMIQLAKSYVCKYTMASKEFKAILGSTNHEENVSHSSFVL